MKKKTLTLGSRPLCLLWGSSWCCSLLPTWAMLSKIGKNLPQCTEIFCSLFLDFFTTTTSTKTNWRWGNHWSEMIRFNSTMQRQRWPIRFGTQKTVIETDRPFLPSDGERCTGGRTLFSEQLTESLQVICLELAGPCMHVGNWAEVEPQM